MKTRILRTFVLSVAVVAGSVSCGGDAASPTAPEGPDTGPDETELPASFAGKIVFVRETGEGPQGDQLMVMDADGTGVASLGVSGVVPDVNPDGQRVAYNRSGNIFVFDLGTEEETLVATSGTNIRPSWSPDGNRILFWSDRTGSKELFTMNPDGSGVTQLTDDPDVEFLEADWSPDGRRIVFRRCSPCNLWLMDAEGTNQEPLLELPDPPSNPQWSPDGSRIALNVDIQSEGPNRDVFVVDADGTNLVRVTTAPGPDNAPHWSPDGNTIVLSGATDLDTRTTGLFTVRPDGTGRELFLNDAGGPTFGPAPDGG